MQQGARYKHQCLLGYELTSGPRGYKSVVGRRLARSFGRDIIDGRGQTNSRISRAYQLAHTFSAKTVTTMPSCEKQLSYHVPHQSQLNTQSSGLSPRMPSLLENPLTFFTNTRHPSQYYHLSFSTKKDCIFSRNTVVNIDVAPLLPVRHIIT
jgi:hypothetical protein